MIDQTSTLRTKTNTGFTTVLLVVGIFGLLTMILSLYVITTESTNSSNSANGLATIFLSIAMLAVVPVTSIALFSYLVLALNLKLSKNTELLSTAELTSYTKKASTVGLIGILIASTFVLFLLYSDRLAINPIYGLFISTTSTGLIPATLVILIWSIRYLLRAHVAQAIITKRSTSSSTLNGQ